MGQTFFFSGNQPTNQTWKQQLNKYIYIQGIQWRRVSPEFLVSLSLRNFRSQESSLVKRLRNVWPGFKIFNGKDIKQKWCQIVCYPWWTSAIIPVKQDPERVANFQVLLLYDAPARLLGCPKKVSKWFRNWPIIHWYMGYHRVITYWLCTKFLRHPSSFKSLFQRQLQWIFKLNLFVTITRGSLQTSLLIWNASCLIAQHG